MDIKTILKKYLVFVIGLYFLAAGIVLIIHSALGTTPISSVNYVLSLNSPLSLGTCTFIVNVLLILGQFWLIRGTKSRQDQISILLQIPFSFIFSTFIDFNMSLAEDLHPSNYITSIALLLLGCLIQSIGVVLEIKPQVAMMSAEGFVNYAARRYNKEFGKFKVIFDFTLVTVAIILSLIFTQRIEGVREGSLIAACITGYIVSFLNNKIMTRKILSRVSSILSNLAFNTNINCIHSPQTAFKFKSNDVGFRNIGQCIVTNMKKILLVATKVFDKTISF